MRASQRLALEIVAMAKRQSKSSPTFHRTRFPSKAIYRYHLDTLLPGSALRPLLIANSKVKQILSI